MAALVPAIQVISKTDHTEQHIVPLSNSATTPLTAASTVRIRTRLISLTTNVFSYARDGGRGSPGLDWYNTWPFPDSLPAPFNDTTKYCRVAAWGFSEVMESTIPDLPVGTELFGYQPIGTAIEELTLKHVAGGAWKEVSERRKRLLGVYNEYVVSEPTVSKGLGGEDDAKRSKALDAIMRVLYGSSFMLNRSTFDWNSKGIHPFGAKQLTWSAEDADLTGAVVFLLAPSGKTGLAFAHQLRRGRPEDKQPRKVVAVGSALSRDFSTATGLFDEVVLYGDLDAPMFDLVAVVGQKPAKILLVNFGARGDAPEKWAEALRPLCERLQVVLVGSDPQAKAMGKLAALCLELDSGVHQMNAGGLRDNARHGAGALAYFEEMGAAWEGFKADGAAGLKVVWGQGIDDYAKGWDAIVRGEYGADNGLVYELP